MEIETINEYGIMKEWMAALFGTTQISPFLFDTEGCRGIIRGMKINGAAAGLAYGIVTTNGDTFFLHRLYIKKQFRNMENVLLLLQEVLRAGGMCQGIKQAVWIYTLSSEKRDIYRELVEKIPFCQVMEQSVFKQFRGESSGTLKWKQYKWYDPSLFRQKGFCVIPWEDYSQKEKDKIKAREQGMALEKTYLSPFLEEGVPFDTMTSYVLTVGQTNEPAGWMICEKMTKQEVKVRRYYMCPEQRQHLVGASFAAFVVDRIRAHYKYICFDLLKGNRQMEMVSARYFDRAWELDCSRYNLIINYKEELK